MSLDILAANFIAYHGDECEGRAYIIWCVGGGGGWVWVGPIWLVWYITT